MNVYIKESRNLVKGHMKSKCCDCLKEIRNILIFEWDPKTSTNIDFEENEWNQVVYTILSSFSNWSYQTEIDKWTMKRETSILKALEW